MAAIVDCHGRHSLARRCAMAAIVDCPPQVPPLVYFSVPWHVHRQEWVHRQPQPAYMRRFDPPTPTPDMWERKMFCRFYDQEYSICNAHFHKLVCNALNLALELGECLGEAPHGRHGRHGHCTPLLHQPLPHAVAGAASTRAAAMAAMVAKNDPSHSTPAVRG